MTQETLAYLCTLMREAGIPYAFGRWEGPAAGTEDGYFVGEYTENHTYAQTENGRQESTFLLRGFTRGGWSILESAKERLREKLPANKRLASGAFAVVLYEHALTVPTGEADLKSIKINLKVLEWRNRRWTP